MAKWHRLSDALWHVEAYYPNGTLCWRYMANFSLVGLNYDRTGTMPVYKDGLLYLPARNGIVVLDSNGSLQWSRTFDGEYNLDLFGPMPFDATGRVYLKDAGISRDVPRYRPGRKCCRAKCDRPRYWLNLLVPGTESILSRL